MRKKTKTPSDDFASMFDEVMGENDEHLGVSAWLDTGIPELNYILSGDYRGGMPVGRMVELYGPAASGKTFLSTMTMKACQQMGGMPIFCDHERAFDPTLAESLGLDTSPAKFRYQRPETFEDSIRIGCNTARLSREKGFPMERPLVLVYDSVASMVPHEKLYDADGNLRKVGDYNMRDSLSLAKATSQNYPQLAQFAGDNNMLVLLLNQTRQKPNVMYGDSTATPGGLAAEFYASIRLSIGRQEITNGKKGKDKEVLGFKVTAKTVKNKLFRPFLQASWQVRFNAGKGVMVDQIATNLDFLVRKGLIPKEGNYCVWEGKKLFQSQLEVALKKDPEANDKLLALLPASGALEDVAESDLELGDIA